MQTALDIDYHVGVTARLQSLHASPPNPACTHVVVYDRCHSCCRPVARCSNCQNIVCRPEVPEDARCTLCSSTAAEVTARHNAEALAQGMPQNLGAWVVCCRNCGRYVCNGCALEGVWHPKCY